METLHCIATHLKIIMPRFIKMLTALKSRKNSLKQPIKQDLFQRSVIETAVWAAVEHV